MARKEGRHWTKVQVSDDNPRPAGRRRRSPAATKARERMRVGILGSGLMGRKLGTLFARAGHQVVFSYSRDRKKLERLARDAGSQAGAGTPAEAARDADALLLAVHWSRVDDVLRQAEDVRGKVIVTCTLPMNQDDTALVVAHTSSGAAERAREAAGGPHLSDLREGPE